MNKTPHCSYRRQVEIFKFIFSLNLVLLKILLIFAKLAYFLQG